MGRVVEGHAQAQAGSDPGELLVEPGVEGRGVLTVAVEGCHHLADLELEEQLGVLPEAALHPVEDHDGEHDDRREHGERVAESPAGTDREAHGKVVPEPQEGRKLAS